MTEAPGDDDDALLTTKQAAAKLGVHLSTLMRLIYAGELASIRIPPVNLAIRDGGRPRNGTRPEHRIEPAEIERFKDRNRQGRCRDCGYEYSAAGHSQTCRPLARATA